MNEKINLTKVDGSTIQVDLVCFLEVVATGRRFIFYTLNEVLGNDANATVKIYVSKVKQNNPALDAPMTGDEWQLFTKNVMKSTIQGSPCPEVKYVPMTELGNPISVGGKAIAMPVFHDYINKQRGLYAESVATSVNDAPQEVAPMTDVQQPEAPQSTNTAPQAPDTMTTQTTVEPSSAPGLASDNLQSNTSFEFASQSANIFDTQSATPAEAPVAVEPTPAATTSATLEPQDTLSIQTPFSESENNVENNGAGAVLEPIDVASIEAKYEEMIANINKLKEQELEAAKRYNATIELSAMHREQHANYVQNEQVKEAPATTVEPAAVVPDATQVMPSESTPQPNPMPGAVTSTTGAINPMEPTPVTPVVPEPVPTTSANLETNWFDMPNNQ